MLLLNMLLVQMICQTLGIIAQQETTSMMFVVV